MSQAGYRVKENMVEVRKQIDRLEVIEAAVSTTPTRVFFGELNTVNGEKEGH